MPRILSTATTRPPHRLLQEEAREFARSHFADAHADIERLLPVFDNAGIQTRFLCQPLDWYTEPQSFAEKNRLAVTWAEQLAEECAQQCLASTGFTAADISHVIFVCSTGLATPSLDARLMQRMGVAPHARRTPLFGLGCAGGAAGLSHASRSALAEPESLVLLVAVETTSLTFLSEDHGKSNLIATALFGDGAAAALIAGDARSESGPEILATRSTLFEDSLAVMGWNFLEHGLQVVFSRAIPGLVKRHSRADIESFLADRRLDIADIDCWIMHPGGVRVLEAYERALGIDPACFAVTREVLRDSGNMSSATVLHVLDRFLGQDMLGAGQCGLLSALGPGFSSEHVLLGG